MASNKRYTVNAEYFDRIDTEEKAYFLGLLYTDGCNYENGDIKIDLVESDSYILKRLKECLESTRPLYHYKEEVKIIDDKLYDCQPSCRFIIKNLHMSKVLSSYGMIARKSVNGEYIKDGIIPDSLYSHFVRGLIDGDGGIGYWTDNEITGHKKFQIHFCSTSDSVTKLADYFSKMFACTPAITNRYPDRDNNNLQFCVDGNNVVRRILDWLYSDATVYLKRKYESYQLLIKENERRANDKTLYGSMHPRRRVMNKITGEIFESVAAAAKSIGKRPPYITVHAKKEDGWSYVDTDEVYVY